ncbi:hypothetical protein [Mucilaginibacter sp. HD30]
MKNKRIVLYSLIVVLTGGIYFAVQAQQKKSTQRANFSGEWKAKESISMGGNIVCLYDEADRMEFNTMKIAQQQNFLTIEVPNLSSGNAGAKSREKLAFNGKASEIIRGPRRGKKFIAKLSADGQTITINTIVSLMIGPPEYFGKNTQKQELTNVTEVWKLSNDGRSISVQTNAKSGVVGEERSWKSVFYKTD